ncbi:MAG: RagB/SusD family nutrient uptake outer membrane protein [Bacteroidales bacterium]|nr:RagB/SusD family nutrient uptake outer membrane protein [Bacteroidales bacterium]
MDEDVYSEIPVDQFGKNQTQVNALVGSIYSTFKVHQMNWDSYVVMDELAADMIAVPGFKGGDWGEPMWRETMQHSWTSSSTGFNGAYTRPSGSISLCNQIYYEINANPAISDDLKSKILAEVRGVRAFWYYTLCDHYGGVPIVTDFLDKTEQPVSKTRKEVFEFIVNELNDIKDKLRDDVATPASYGKFTKGTAYTLLAKMYLNAEVWNPSGGAKWQECIDACNVVLNMPYILEPNWKTNFIARNEVSKEAILSAVFKAGGSGDQNNIGVNTLHYLDPIALGLNISPWNGLAANPNYVKEYDTTDLRYRGSFLFGPMIDPNTGEVLITGHGRPLIHTIDMELNDVDETGWGWINQEEGARINKWDFEPGLSTSQENDVHIFRLADVYLMKAEALLRWVLMLTKPQTS